MSTTTATSTIRGAIITEAGYDCHESELTGLDEHLRDEAHECGELAAMRREAQEANRLEALAAEAEAEDEEAAWQARQADPLLAVCEWHDFGALRGECVAGLLF